MTEAVDAMKRDDPEAQHTTAKPTAQERRKIGRGWDTRGGKHVEPLVSQFDLVDVGFLIGLGEAGAAIPSHAEVPDSARINASNVWRLRCWDDASSLPVLVLSCPKLDQAHPDKHGELLRRMLPVLVACNKQAARYGPRATVGVFWEYMSVPQVESRLSGVEYSESIDAAIRSLFAHPFTLVLCVRTPIPAGDYLNKLPYERRGDRLIEQRIASIVKDPGCLHAHSNRTSI